MSDELRERVAEKFREMTNLEHQAGRARTWEELAAAAIALVRAETLEEAAKRCEDFLGGAWHGYEIAAAIRSLRP